MAKGYLEIVNTRNLLPLILSLATAAALPRPVPAQQVDSTEPGRQLADTSGEILTPPPAKIAAIHGPKIFGVHPGSPFLYSIPATGDRPIHFSARHLPHGLDLNPSTGQITGRVRHRGTYRVILHATNSLGTSSRPFTIQVGDDIALTPVMGWNSYNVWGTHVDANRMLAAAHAMVSSGLAEHGYAYVNMDDGWQGKRGGPLNAVQPNPNLFPDMKKMVDEIHALGLKVGIYHTPWITSYGRRIGGSSDNPQGAWDAATMTQGVRNKKQFPYMIGRYHFNAQDAKQFADWGIDYLKYDWAPVEAPPTVEEQKALRDTGRDIVLSLSNNATHSLLGVIGEVAPYANSWRTGHDIRDTWASVVHNGFNQDAWAPYARPGHFNDPDMLVTGIVGWGHPHPTRLTPDEQYSLMSMWCLAASPLILGNDLTQLDAFTLGLLTNDEVLDVDQDPLGKQATIVAHGSTDDGDDWQVYAKPLDDGSWAAGLFNLGKASATVSIQWSSIGSHGQQVVRDLWRQKDIGQFDNGFSVQVASHGVALVRIVPVRISNRR